MPAFRTLQTVHLLPEIIKHATFADALTSTVNYLGSNQTVKKKIRDDHLFNELGEEAVYLETL